MFEKLRVKGGVVLARFCPGVQVTQLHAQNRRLQRVKPAVHADNLGVVLLPRAVGAQESQTSAIERSRAVTMPPSPAQPRFLEGKKLKHPKSPMLADFLPIVGDANGLGGIFNRRPANVFAAILERGCIAADSPNR